MAADRAASSEREQALRLAPWWLRLFLLVNVVQDFAIGLSGALVPSRSLLPLHGLTPLNVRFISALYLGGGVVILAAALVRYAIDARIALYAFLVITVLVLAMTFAYWSDFTSTGVPWLWMVTYTIDPVLTIVFLVVLGLRRPATSGRHPRTALFLGEAVVLGSVGLLLLLAPDAAEQIWPWVLTTLLARVYSAFFLAFAVGAVLSAFEQRSAAVRPFLVGSLALAICVLWACLHHLDRFSQGPSSWLWFATLIAGTAVFAVAATRPGRRPAPA